MCTIVPHSNTPETLPRILSAHKELVKGRCLTSSWTNCRAIHNETRASSVLEISFGLSEASFVCQKPGAHNVSLFVKVASSR